MRASVIHLVPTIFAVAAAYAAPGTWSGTVPATSGPGTPVDTGLTVERREFVMVSVSGSMNTGNGAPNNGPCGTWWHGSADYGYTTGIVGLLIGGNHIPIECGQRAFVVPYPGRVYAYVNDLQPENNSGSYSVSITVYPASVGDQDGDGLEDALEDALLDWYAPQLKFDTEEDIRPCDAYYFLRVSSLRDDTNGGYPIVFEQAPFYPEPGLFTIPVLIA